MTFCNGQTLSNKKIVVAVVHARMGSTRFPGKMMELLGGYPVAEWVVRRTLRARGIDHFVLATSDLPQDDMLVKLGERIGITTFRGSNENVLQRVLGAAEQFRADAVVRICADNPFIDPELISSLVADFRSNWCDYMFNHRPGLGLAIADGFGGEVFDVAVLRSIENRFEEPRYQEHLTLAFWEHEDIFTVRSLAPSPALADSCLRFDVDAPNDLKYLNQLVEEGGLTMLSSAAQIMDVARAT